MGIGRKSKIMKECAGAFKLLMFVLWSLVLEFAKIALGIFLIAMGLIFRFMFWFLKVVFLMPFWLMGLSAEHSNRKIARRKARREGRNQFYLELIGMELLSRSFHEDHHHYY